jgi:hypothetical protein
MRHVTRGCQRSPGGIVPDGTRVTVARRGIRPSPRGARGLLATNRNRRRSLVELPIRTGSFRR